MGKNLNLAREYLAVEKTVLSLENQVLERGWNLRGLSPFIGWKSAEYSAFLTKLLESPEVVDTGEVRIVPVEGDFCKVEDGRFYIGIATPIDKVLQFLKE